MPGNHKCKQCDVVYACCADECDEHYWLLCTPCEMKNYNSEHGIIDHKLRIAPEYVLEDETGIFCHCEECGVTMNCHSDVCNKCYVKAGGILV